MNLDPRRHAVRPDLADEALRDRVSAPAYAAGEPAQIAAPVAAVLARAEDDAPPVTEFLYGERVKVFERSGGFAWVQSAVDGYVGYVADGALIPPGAPPTHKVSVPLALVYSVPSIKVPPALRLPMGAVLPAGAAEDVGGERFHETALGFILAQHLAPLSAHADFVSTAELFVGAPYAWGGRSWFGIDCSGLVQLALQMAGHNAPRDSDMQEAEVGTPADTLARGDLVFWRGHLGIMVDDTRLLHANGHHMRTVIEPLTETHARLASLGLTPSAMRRPFP